jgi:hypothetical protein
MNSILGFLDWDCQMAQNSNLDTCSILGIFIDQTFPGYPQDGVPNMSSQILI